MLHPFEAWLLLVHGQKNVVKVTLLVQAGRHLRGGESMQKRHNLKLDPSLSNRQVSLFLKKLVGSSTVAASAACAFENGACFWHPSSLFRALVATSLRAPWVLLIHTFWSRLEFVRE
jgi:hypothetical protein